MSLKNRRISLKHPLKTDILLSKKETFIIFAVAFIGILARVYKFGSLPFAVNQDEAMAAARAAE